jgi:hypothetical protein
VTRIVFVAHVAAVAQVIVVTLRAFPTNTDDALLFTCVTRHILVFHSYIREKT